jgi:hypothetical protein
MTPTTFAAPRVTAFAPGGHLGARNNEQARTPLLIDPTHLPMPIARDARREPSGANHDQRLVEQFGFHRQHRSL